MKDIVFVAFMLTLVAFWPPASVSASASVISKESYYLVSRPIPIGQNVPLFRHRNPARRYDSYLWMLIRTEAGLKLIKVSSIPTGGGIQQIKLWPSASLLAVCGWPNDYGWEQNLNKGKWSHGNMVSLIDLTSPRHYVRLWLPNRSLDLLVSTQSADRLPSLLMPNSHVSMILDLNTGTIKRINSFHVPWRYNYFNGGASDTLPFLWAKIRKEGDVWVSPSMPHHLSLGDIKYFVRLPWKISATVLKQAGGSNPKYTWMLANTSRVLVIGRPNKSAPTNKICLLIFNKVGKIWAAHWIISGSDSFRLWSFGPWVVMRIYGPDDGDNYWKATGAYWFFNSVTGQAWQQKLGGSGTWVLYMNSHHALVRKGDKIFRYSLHANRLVNPKLLIRDKRLRCVYWACPVPKPQPPGTRHRFRFFWERPDYKLPKALQPPIQHPPTTMRKRKRGITNNAR